MAFSLHFGKILKCTPGKILESLILAALNTDQTFELNSPF